MKVRPEEGNNYSRTYPIPPEGTTNPQEEYRSNEDSTPEGATIEIKRNHQSYVGSKYPSFVSITCAPKVPHKYFWKGSSAQVNDKTLPRTRQSYF